MVNDIQKKIQNLPSEMVEYLHSMKGTELNVQFCEKYEIRSENMIKVPNLVAKVFTGELSLKEVPSVLKREFKVKDSVAKQMARDIAGYRFLVVDDHLEEDVASFIERMGGDPADYVQKVQEQKEALPQEREFFRKELEEEEEAESSDSKESVQEEEEEEMEFDPQKEKKDSIELFKYSLISVLNSEEVPDDFLSEYNLVLAKYLSEEDGGDFRKKLENALLANQEKLTSKEFYLEDKKTTPTVGNWIKHFLKEQGSEEFDNLALSEFLSNSKNTAGLTEKEKRLVGKVLILYRNLKFFPDPFKDLSINEWEIIPSSWKKISGNERDQKNERETEKKEESSSGQSSSKEERDNKDKETFENEINKDKQRKEKESIENKRNKNKQSETKTETLPKSHSESRLEKLKRIKNNYEEGSLERKAIEGEIREIENRK